ncbi:MAG: EamA family transporter [Verrucomicrobiota bacterium]
MVPVVTLCAAGAATLYAAGSLQIKRSLSAGATKRRAIAVTNVAMFLWALPLFFISRGEFDWGAWSTAVCAGIALFLGRILSVKALEVGDLSIVGPLLGMKTLLVAVFSFATGQKELTTWLWIAAILATIGVVLIQRGPRKFTRHRREAAFYAAGASVLFAACDIMVVEARGQLGIGWLSPTLFMTVAILVPFLGKHPAPPQKARKAIYIGSVIMGFQTSLVILLIGLTGQAVLINIVYSSRAIWTVIVDRFFGRGEGVAAFFKWRLTGSALLVGAIAIVIFER